MRKELDKWFPAVSNFALQETFGTIWRYFVLSQLEGEFAIVTSWVEGRDDPKHSTKHRTALQKKRIIQPKMSVETVFGSGFFPEVHSFKRFINPLKMCATF